MVFGKYWMKNMKVSSKEYKIFNFRKWGVKEVLISKKTR